LIAIIGSKIFNLFCLILRLQVMNELVTRRFFQKKGSIYTQLARNFQIKDYFQEHKIKSLR
ncbi:hypothetical protein EBS43_05580, partial [bacterium]|nr:hypothetical protein [bacterium]